MKVYKCIVNFKLTKFEIVLRQSVEIIRSQKEKKKKKKKKKKKNTAHRMRTSCE